MHVMILSILSIICVDLLIKHAEKPRAHLTFLQRRRPLRYPNF